MAEHQENHARILELRQTADKLDGQIKQAISILRDTRNDLLATPFTPFPAESRNVPFDELLRFAKNISKFTVPPSSVVLPPPIPVEKADGGGARDEGGTETRGDAVDENADGQKQPPATANDATMQAMSEPARQWLEQLMQNALGLFLPWPSEERIKYGALADIWRMMERGEDPAAVGRGTVGEGAGQGAAGVEERTQDDGRKDSSAIDSGRVRQSTAQGAPAQSSAFTGFGLYDPSQG